MIIKVFKSNLFSVYIEAVVAVETYICTGKLQTCPEENLHSIESGLPKAIKVNG